MGRTTRRREPGEVVNTKRSTKKMSRRNNRKNLKKNLIKKKIQPYRNLKNTKQSKKTSV